MPSIATQTCWSWVQDLATLEKLACVHGVASSKLSVGQEATESESLATRNRSCIDHDIHPSNGSSKPVCNDHLPPLILRDEAGVSVHACSGSHSKTHLPYITENIAEIPTATSSCNAILALPSIADKVVSFDVSVEDDKTISNTADITTFSALHQLERIDYSDDDEDSDQSESETSNDEEESDDEDREPPSKPNIPDLQPVSDLPWPTILRYVRESESMASRYFSLQNKEEVDKRTAEAKALLTQEQDPSIECLDPSIKHSSGPSEDLDDHITGDNPKPEEAKVAITVCHFCGKNLPRRSLLEDTRDIEKIQEQDYICCEDYKNYTVLVAVCMRQMVEKMRTAPPSVISVKPHTKVSEKKLLEDKALALLRKKQKWEEIQRRKQQEAEARKRIKGTRTIQFTLESPGEQERRWMAPARPRSSRNNSKKKEVKKKKIDKKMEMFSTETLERLKQQNNLPPGELVRREYDSGTLCSMILPDRTGYCNYPSGRKAVVIFSLYEGALAYMVYEDSDFPQLLACADELGRCCCYYKDGGGIRLLSVPQLLLQLDVGGHTCRKLKSSDPATPILFQPVTISLNKHVTLKCNQDCTSLLLTFPNDHIKFTMSSKLQKDEIPLYSHQLQSSMVAAETSLSKTKARIGQLLHLLQNISQIQKLCKLESLYGTPQIRGPKNQHTHRQEWDASRKRTRSTGAIKAKKNVSTEKHLKATTLNLL